LQPIIEDNERVNMEPKFKIKKISISYDMDQNNDQESPPEMDLQIQEAIIKLGYTVDVVESFAI
jgi:hypothetical protein